MKNYQDSINTILAGIKSFVEDIQTANREDGDKIRKLREGINERTDLMSSFADSLHECADVMDTVVSLNDDVLDIDPEDDFVGYDDGYQIYIEQAEDDLYADDDEDEDEVPNTDGDTVVNG